jgi:hypothetical protein
MSDFAIQVRLKTLAGSTLYDLHDEANGLEVLAPIGMSSEQWRRAVETGRYVDGSDETSAVLDSSELVVRLLVSGATWPQAEARFMAARAAWIDEPNFLVDVIVEGVTTSWRANRPDWGSSDLDVEDVMNRQRIYTLTFPVQPSPTMSGV